VSKEKKLHKLGSTAQIMPFKKDGTETQMTTSYVTPARLLELYDVPDYEAVAEGNSQCVASFVQEWYDDDDIDHFWSVFDLPKTYLQRVPDRQPEGFGSEAILDVEYITVTGNGVPTLVWDIEDDGYFLTLVEQLVSSETIPWVVSMSYGGDEQDNGMEFCRRGNIEFLKATTLGITFFASSGDTGCTSTSGECADGQFVPSFPASSPWVIAVGGTQGGDTKRYKSAFGSEEVAWSNSGGGFSVYFDRLPFQQEAVQTYLTENKESLPDASRFNEDGRAYPDIAVQAVGYVIAYDSALYTVSGTSCSCPVVAGMFSTINDRRLSAGKAPLGYVLPALYSLYGEGSMEEYFNDITSGSNLGCTDDDAIGFSAAQGWDPVSGLGTPKLSKLIEYFVNLP